MIDKTVKLKIYLQGRGWEFEVALVEWAGHTFSNRTVS